MKNAFTIGLIANDKVGNIMAGPGIRYVEMAKCFSKKARTVLFVPGKTDISIPDVGIREYNGFRSLAKMIGDCDVIISQSLRPNVLFEVKKNGSLYIADLYDPLTIEVLEYNKYQSERNQQNTFLFEYSNLILQLQAADHILCSSERQKDLYLGFLSARKFINPKRYKLDPDLEKFITIAPFGMSSVEPEATNISRLEENNPGIKKGDKIVYWGGGVWNWFDPLSIVKAIEIISKKRDDIKLFFLGVKHPNPKIPIMRMAQETLDYCKKKDLLDKFVFFNFGWTPYDERIDYLKRASIGISSHFDNLETRFSFRTRVLDYLWAQIPIITTRGDSMADLVEKYTLGKVVDFSSTAEISACIEELIDNSNLSSQISGNIRKIRADFFWENIVERIWRKVEKKETLKRELSLIKLLFCSMNFYYCGLKKKLFK